MRKLFFIVLLITANTLLAQNPYLGKWVKYDIKSFKDRDTLSDVQKSNFNSAIIFNEDLTFIKITNGDTISGKYEYTSTKLKFLEKNTQGEFLIRWSLRWPKNTNDPLPNTAIIDLCYPELFTINGKLAELDVYYMKENAPSNAH